MLLFYSGGKGGDGVLIIEVIRVFGEGSARLSLCF